MCGDVCLRVGDVCNAIGNRLVGVEAYRTREGTRLSSDECQSILMKVRKGVKTRFQADAFSSPEAPPLLLTRPMVKQRSLSAGNVQNVKHHDKDFKHMKNKHTDTGKDTDSDRRIKSEVMWRWKKDDEVVFLSTLTWWFPTPSPLAQQCMPPTSPHTHTHTALTLPPLLSTRNYQRMYTCCPIRSPPTITAKCQRLSPSNNHYTEFQKSLWSISSLTRDFLVPFPAPGDRLN